MRFVRDLKIGQLIQAVKFGKNIEGTITKKLPGAVVIRRNDNQQLEVVDIDRVKHNNDKQNEQKTKRNRTTGTKHRKISRQHSSRSKTNIKTNKS